MKIEGLETFTPKSKKDWRKWLHKNHDKKQSVWIICYKMSASQPSVSWSDLVDEALCFGWIDSTRKTVDDERFMQLFSVRKPRGTWSKVNKEKIIRLTEEGHMMPAGLTAIEKAKENGSWNLLDEVEELTVPKELLAAFKKHKGAEAYFESLSKSVKKMILHRIALAKLPETKEKRIQEIAELAGKGMRPKGI